MTLRSQLKLYVEFPTHTQRCHQTVSPEGYLDVVRLGTHSPCLETYVTILGLYMSGHALTSSVDVKILSVLSLCSR